MTKDDIVDEIRNVIVNCDPGGWRCFHCGEQYFDEQLAMEHFGSDPTQLPACRVDAAYLRELEVFRDEVLSESTEHDKEIAKLRSELSRKVREAEELGYQRGLEDAKKYPQELGLQPME